MTTGSVPFRYARALLAIGEETKQLPVLQREWADLRATADGAPALLPFLANPQVPPEKRKAVLAEVLKAAGATPTTRAAAGLLFQKGRIVLLADVARAFERMVEAKTGRMRAKVTTAAAMPDAFHQRLQSALEKQTKRTLTVEKAVDAAILGGVVAKVGDLLFDGSVRTALERLRERLLAEG